MIDPNRLQKLVMKIGKLVKNFDRNWANWKCVGHFWLAPIEKSPDGFLIRTFAIVWDSWTNYCRIFRDPSGSLRLFEDLCKGCSPLLGRLFCLFICLLFVWKGDDGQRETRRRLNKVTATKWRWNGFDGGGSPATGETADGGGVAFPGRGGGVVEGVFIIIFFSFFLFGSVSFIVRAPLWTKSNQKKKNK